MGVKPYARHRKGLGLIGGTPPAVRKALTRHGITQAEDGSFDADELHAAWAAEQAGGDALGGETGGGTRGTARGEPAPPPGDVKGQHGSRGYWLTRHERARALDREHALELKLGSAVPVDYMVEQLEAALTSAASKFMNFPGVLALAVAGLQQDFRGGLTDLRTELESRGDAAGLAVLERVVALDTHAVARAQELLDAAIQGVLPMLVALGDEECDD